MKRLLFALLFLLPALSWGSDLGIPDSGPGNCSSGFINPVTEISWRCIFPMRIGGAEVASYGETDPTGQTTSPICICTGGTLPRLGVKIEFWEPSRIIDTVANPYCMMPLGAKIAQPKPGTLRGGLIYQPGGNAKAFAQMHYYIFPAWKILDMFWDIPCLDDKGFDVAMLSELNPAWNNEVLALLINPEAILFANPVSALACSADAIAANLGRPRNELFWCMGSWGNAYPIAGSITSTDYVEANAGLAARGIYSMARMGLLMDTTPDGCALTPTPIWKKNRYRLQMAKPVTQNGCQPIGEDALIWTKGASPTVRDNFMWIQFKKVDCCVTY